MEINVIHIYGGSGSGTSTLGYAFSRESGYYFMDADDYLWLPTIRGLLKCEKAENGSG